MAKTLSAEQAYKLEADSIAKACPKDFLNKVIPNKNPQGYDSISAIMGCSKHPQIKDRNEIGFYTFLKGKSEIYMLKKSFREALADNNSPKLDESTSQNFSSGSSKLKDLQE